MIPLWRWVPCVERLNVYPHAWSLEEGDCLVPGAGLEPARTLPGPRDFKSRVSTNSTIRALHRSYEGKTEIEANWTLNREGLSYKRPSRKEIKLNEQWRQYQCDRA